LNVPVGDDNITRREHYEQLGLWDQLEPPVEFPQELQGVWFAFLELHNARPEGAMGPGRISYEGIKAWMECTGQTLSPWAVSLIKRLDNVWLKTNNEARKSTQRSKGSK